MKITHIFVHLILGGESLLEAQLEGNPSLYNHFPPREKEGGRKRRREVRKKLNWRLLWKMIMKTIITTLKTL